MNSKVEKLSAGDVFPKFYDWDKILEISIHKMHDYEIKERGCKTKNILQECMNHKTAANSRHISLKKNSVFKSINRDLRINLAEFTEKKYVELRNYIMYPKNGYMGWHTNRNCVGMRYYLTWAEEEGKSFFKYFDGDKIVSVPDVKGWQVNKFLVARNYQFNDYKYFLHSVESNTNRLSIGYKVI